jgi:hypothetical protein
MFSTILQVGEKFVGEKLEVEILKFLMFSAILQVGEKFFGEKLEVEISDVFGDFASRRKKAQVGDRPTDT